MNDREISKEEGLKIIQGMISLARNKFNNDGFHFILWGGLVIITSLLLYILNYSNEANTFYWIWGLVPLIGIPAAFFYESRKSSKGRSINRFDKLYGYLWFGFGITLMIIVYVSLSNGINPLAFILALVGLAVFVSGKIYQFRPLIIGAIFVWGGAIFCPYLDGNNQLLLNAIAILLGYVIPGILLWRKNKSSV